ncbi:DNA primase [Streptomyces sp. NPDC051041]|uniref:DNA primase n=1 Tax=Streptomyces sp. NPDC051041 TaxID=3365640 RepID=UPI00379308E9
MNRVGLGLAVGAGYVLGRTRKMKLAFAVGTFVAGRRMKLSPRAVAGLVNQQLQNNPQFKEIGDQLRQDLRGVGKAASGAVLERQLDALADRLHGRTAQVRDQLSGVAAGAPDRGPDASDETAEKSPDAGDEEPRDGTAEESAAEAGPRGGTARKAAAARKTAAGRAPARKTAAKKTAAAKKAVRKTAGRTRPSKDGGE